MRWKVMISAPYMQPVIDEYRHVFEANNIELFIPPVKERLNEQELLGYIGDIDGVICGDDRFTERVFQKAKKLKVVCKWGTGVDSIDRDAAAKRGIPVHNTPGAFTDPVADSVLGYILCFARQQPWMTQDMRQGRWEKRPCVALCECTLGVIGVGAIGKAVVRRARAFGMRLLGNDVVAMPDDFLSETGIVMTSKDALLAEADFVSLNCDLNPTSYHLMDESAFSLMKNTAYLINTSRGPVIDEQALVRALNEKCIAGAALDVFEEEPLPSDSPLRSMDNCLLAPHNANSSPSAWRRVHENTIKKLIEGLQSSR